MGNVNKLEDGIRDIILHHNNEGLTNIDEGFNIRDILNTENITKSAIDSCEFLITPNRVKQERAKHNFEEAKIQVNHSWHVDLMEDWLKDYHEKDIMKYIW